MPPLPPPSFDILGGPHPASPVILAVPHAGRDYPAALIDALGVAKVILVAHDWGGAAAWLFAMSFPQMIERLIILNSPHPATRASASQCFRNCP